MSALIIELVDDDAGATAIEYGLILALIALAMIAAAFALGVETTDMWNRVAAEVTGVIGSNSKTPEAD